MRWDSGRGEGFDRSVARLSNFGRRTADGGCPHMQPAGLVRGAGFALAFWRLFVFVAEVESEVGFGAGAGDLERNLGYGSVLFKKRIYGLQQNRFPARRQL